MDVSVIVTNFNYGKLIRRCIRSLLNQNLSYKNFEIIIIDVDNCDAITSQFITFLLAHPNSYYITNDDTIPYNLISKNRIYNLDWIIEKIKQDEDDTDVEEE